jgi:hypothetical protein
LGQPQGFTDVADGAGVAVLDESADLGGVLRAVGLEDAAEHLVARLAAEVEVDVRYVLLQPLLVEEALHDEVVLHRVDAGEAEEEADERADGGAAAAHRQVTLVRRLDQLPEPEEEARPPATADQVQLHP